MSDPQGNIEPVRRAPDPVDPGVRIGHVHLRTADIDRIREFCVDVLGFDVIAEARDVPGWGTTGDILFVSAGGITTTSASTRGSRRTVRLSRTASPSPTPPVPRWPTPYRRLKDVDWPIRQTTDHGTHEAIYISDPDANDVELMWDRPVEQWPRDDRGHMDARFGDELDLDELLRELR